MSRQLKACPYCGRSFENKNPRGTLPAGTILAGRYILDKCVALDGEGVSYAAVDAKLAKRVLVKEYVPVTICAARTQNGSVVPRPEREVLFKTTRMDFIDLYTSLMTVEHSVGLCGVFDLVQANNTAYAVQELPTGTTLGVYLRTHKVPLTQREAVALLRPIFYAIEAMHKKGLLHRGISPDTIFISSDGRAKLSGFATLGLRTADSELKSCVFSGYAAPEQYAVAEFDGKYTDVYGLAAVFYKAVTGTEPPAANLRRMSDTLVPPRNIAQTLPVFVASALMRALRLTGVERMNSAADLLRALTEPVNTNKPKASFIKEKHILPILAGIIALIVVFFVGYYFINTDKQDEEDSSVVSESTAPSSSAPAEPETIVVPSFVNQEYALIQQDEENIKNFLFSVSEEYSSVFAAGRVMDQSPVDGTSVAPGTIIEITISKGPETIVMPTVVGLSRVDAKALLDTMGISHNVYERANDGRYTQDTVVECDVAEGTSIDPSRVVVTLYVAQAPIASSLPPPIVDSVPDASSSDATTPTP